MMWLVERTDEATVDCVPEQLGRASQFRPRPESCPLRAGGTRTSVLEPVGTEGGSRRLRARLADLPGACPGICHPGIRRDPVGEW